MVIPELSDFNNSGKLRSYQEEVISTVHQLVGYLGWKKTYHSVKKDYFWLNLCKDIIEYCQTCDTCQRNKSTTQKPAGLLHQPAIPLRPGTHYAMDFVGPLPKSKYNGKTYDTIFTVVDRFNGWVFALPTIQEATAEDTATLFFDAVVSFKGLPISIISDRDTRFKSNFWTALMNKLHVSLDMSSAFHPQTDGSSERANKTIIQTLRNSASARQDNWAPHLAQITYAINTAVNESTGFSPFYLTYGYNPNPLPDTGVVTSVPAADEFLDHMLGIQHMATENLIHARESQERHANQKRRSSPPYSVGQQVLLSMANINPRTPVKSKLQPKWSGPFTVKKFFPETANICLDLPHNWKIHNIFHTSLVKPYHPNDDMKFPGRSHKRPPPVPETDPQEEIYEVEAILDHKKIRNSTHYLVKWLGWPSSDNSWVKETDITADDLLTEYRTKVSAPDPSLRRSPRKKVRFAT